MGLSEVWVSSSVRSHWGLSGFCEGFVIVQVRHNGAMEQSGRTREVESRQIFESIS